MRPTQRPACLILSHASSSQTHSASPTSRPAFPWLCPPVKSPPPAFTYPWMLRNIHTHKHLLVLFNTHTHTHMRTVQPCMQHHHNRTRTSPGAVPSPPFHHHSCPRPYTTPIPHHHYATHSHPSGLAQPSQGSAQPRPGMWPHWKLGSVRRRAYCSYCARRHLLQRVHWIQCSTLCVSYVRRACVCMCVGEEGEKE